MAATGKQLVLNIQTSPQNTNAHTAANTATPTTNPYAGVNTATPNTNPYAGVNTATPNTNPYAGVNILTPQDITYQNAEVAGIVTKVNFAQRRGDPTTFRIYCPNMQKSFEASCNLFCPIREGDTIYALCKLGPDSRLYVTRPPFVQPAIDRDSIIQCFMRALRQGYGPAMGLYQTLSRIAGGDEAVIPFLTGIAQSWNDTHNADILFMFDRIDPDNVKKLLVWWHKERNLRRLYLFGLTKKEINACRLTCDEIYLKCMENPYTLPAIPLDKCDAILDRLNKTPDPVNRLRGAIIRMIWKYLHENGWTGMPTRFLARQFPGIREHAEALKQEYKMVAELETAYLPFPHKVETWITNYIVDKVRKDPITYDMPLDEPITLADGTIVERHSAHFSQDMSEDQQRAVQGALDHSICIITGAAGTGKCLAIGTPILMFDGSIKKIETIKEGDLVMGPDSLPRRVLSKCFGMDNMFEIIPSKGRSFVCNTPHVLTLKGFEPYLGTRKEREKCHVAHYSEKGIKRRKAFTTKEEAQKFIDALSQDIFDIPLNEFILRSADHQRYSYLFHVGVDFPKRELPMDPYLIGYWLGDGSSACAQITTDDKEIVQEFYRVLRSYDMTLTETNYLLGYYIRSNGDDYRKHGGNKFLNALRDLDMLNNKHIPDLYKINSRGNRLKLLAGLIDSDGHNAGNYIEITQKNKRLADDIEYLAFSLGFMVTRVECEKGCEYKGEMRYGIYQRMTIFGEGLEDIPVILDRKKCYPRQLVRRATCQRFEVRPLGKGIYCGFTLDGDSRFLLGDFLVTHNTRSLGQLIHNLELRGISYAVCSFTGKAVARIREVTKKRNPATMHRLIANARTNQLDRRPTQYEKDIPLGNYDHIVIDETSMVTEELYYDLAQAYPNVKNWTFVGDVNQLPPIGWGSLFQQLLKSETIPTYRLTTNYRVYTTDGERDGIILNANAIISHDPQYPFEFVQTDNFSIIEGPIERVYDIIRGCFAGGVRADQIAIITPYNRPLSSLNRTFQDIYNAGARSITDSRGVRWMVGDRVMLLDNDKDIGVMNGETGVIRDLTPQALLVDFGQAGCHEFLVEPTNEGRVNYAQGVSNPYYRRGQKVEEVMDGDEGEFDDERTVKRLQVAYALTIDKSQGSEWDFEIFYIDEFNAGSFLNRNRIYTGITRAKRAIWCVVADIDAFNIVAVKPTPYRCENLARRLAAELPNLKPFKIAAPVPALEMNGDMAAGPELPADVTDTGFDCDDFE